LAKAEREILKMKKALFVITLVAFFGTASNSYAEAKKKSTTTTTTTESHSSSGGQSYKKMRYGMAGCGLGAMFIEKNTMLPQIGAWVVNVWSGSQTFAITTGTSNCTDKPAEHAKIEQEVFLQANYASLTREAAQGSGEHLSAFAEVLGCDHGAFSRMSQEKYNEIYGTTEASEVLQNYVKQIKANPELANSCTRVAAN